MNDIICPHCGKAFKIDESGYADILKQVRDHAFEEQLHERLELAERDKQSAVELAKAQLTTELQKAASVKDSEILALRGKLAAANQAQQLAVAQALSTAEKERDALANQLEQTRRDHEAAHDGGHDRTRSQRIDDHGRQGEDQRHDQKSAEVRPGRAEGGAERVPRRRVEVDTAFGVAGPLLVEAEHPVAVVGDDDFKVLKILVKNALQAGLHKSLVVVAGHNHADEGAFAQPQSIEQVHGCCRL